MISLLLIQVSNEPMHSDEELLIKRAQKGESEALEALILSCEKKVYNLAYRFMGNEADAYDMSQESLIKVYRGIKSFRFQSSFSSWVYRLTVNTCLDGLRKRKKAPVSLDNTIESGITLEDKQSVTPEIYVLNIECREDIQKAINSLTTDHRIAVILRDVQGLTYEEISDCLQISVGTVKSRLNRGRQRLKEILIRS